MMDINTSSPAPKFDTSSSNNLNDDEQTVAGHLLSIQECLELQLQEIEMLQSMFANPGEFNMFDDSMLTNVQTFVNSSKSGDQSLPNHLDFTVSVTVIDKIKLSICIHLPHMYPCIEPEIFVRSDQLNRKQETEFNLELNKMVLSCERNVMCLYTVIDWIQENIPKFHSDGKLFFYFLFYYNQYSKRRSFLTNIGIFICHSSLSGTR